MTAAKRETTEQRRERVLQELAKYHKAQADLEDVEALVKLLRNESDRGLVIILVSFIEDELVRAILARLTTHSDKERKALTRAGAPLSSMDGCAKLAAAMGIIQPHMVSLIGTLKAMRNACAHSRNEINFSTHALTEALRLCIEGAEDFDPFPASLPDLARDVFVFTADAVLRHIDGTETNPDEGIAAKIIMRLRQPA